MELQTFLDYMNTGEVITGGSELHLEMIRLSQEAIKLTSELNSSYHTPEEICRIMTELTGRPVDRSFGMFPPFYTDCGKNTVFGKNVFINSGCCFQDQGGLVIGDGALIGQQVVIAEIYEQLALPRPMSRLLQGEVGSGKTLVSLLTMLRAELQALADASPDERETTLLIAPRGFDDFLDFNDLLDEADAVVTALDLDGTLQVAPFHPRFQFAGTDEDDITNATNRAPYPTLHLLREESLDRAVEVFPEAEEIFERNIEVLERLGMQGWVDLDVGARCPMGHGGKKDDEKGGA